MALLLSGHAADPSQPKPRRHARLLQAEQAHPVSCVPSDVGRQVETPHHSQATGVAHTRLIPLTDWNQHHAWPPIGGLRHLVFFEHTNGFDKVVRRVGRRVLIDEAAFFAWIDGNGGAK